MRTIKHFCQVWLSGNAFCASRQVSENLKLFKKPEPGAQFQCEWTSSIDQLSQSTRGSKAELTTRSWYSSLLEPERLQRALQHSQANGALLLSLCRISALGSDLKRGKVFIPCPSTRISPSKPVFQQTRSSPDQACPDPHYLDIDIRPVYGSSAFNFSKVI